MDTSSIRQKYLNFFKDRGHKVIPRALLVPLNDPTTLFTGSGMQPLIPYLLGETHQDGNRLVNSQTCLRAQDIEEVGDNRHTTFFEMLGNWSLGDYFKKEQLPWFFEYLIDVVGLDPKRLYVTCCSGFPEYNVPKDTVSAALWKQLFEAKGIEAKEVEVGSESNGYKIGDLNGRIFFYDEKNWWSRNGAPKDVKVGEPCGPDSEVFYQLSTVQHDAKWGENCHPNCDCGRYIEIGNSVFMEYLRTEKGFEKLPKQNVDFGGGLERIAQAALDSPDMFKISVIWPIIEELVALSGKAFESHTSSMRIIADHLRTATFLAVDGVVPSNKEQGYVMRRFIRRAVRYAFDLGIEQNFLEPVIPIIADLYKDDFPEVAAKRQEVIDILIKEEKIFRQTLRQGMNDIDKLYYRFEGEKQAGREPAVGGEYLFYLYDTRGFPVELAVEELFKKGLNLNKEWKHQFETKMAEQRERSKTANRGTFKGGLGGHSDIHKKYHTATHLMYKAIRLVLGDHVIQRGSNITEERLRFDFSHPTKVTPEQITEIETIVNENITKDWPVTYTEMSADEAFKQGALGAFGDKYGDKVKVYTAGDPNGEWFSKEICGGPHVNHTGQLADGGKKFKIIKEEASSGGIRRIKAVLR